MEVLKAQLDKYAGKLENNVDKLAEFSTKTRNVDLAGRIVLNDAGKPVFNFGKHKGKLVVDVLEKEPSYYAWMEGGDFTLNTKRVLTQIKMNPEKYR